jgi:hypothetical protein
MHDSALHTEQMHVHCSLRFLGIPRSGLCDVNSGVVGWRMGTRVIRVVLFWSLCYDWKLDFGACSRHTMADEDCLEVAGGYREMSEG